MGESCDSFGFFQGLLLENNLYIFIYTYHI